MRLSDFSRRSCRGCEKSSLVGAGICWHETIGEIRGYDFSALLLEMVFLGSEEAVDLLETPIHHLFVLCRTPSIGQTSDIMDNRAIIGSCNVDSFNSFNTTITDDKNQVLKWLSSLEPQRRHQHIRESRLKGTGNWIFEKSEFRRWNTREDGSSHRVLFCHGDPGVGKTHLR